MKKLLFVFNPTTGGGRIKNRLLEIITLFSSKGYELIVCPTHKQGDARDIVKRRGASVSLVVCSGGDGTLNEVVDALMTLEKPPLLGYIPGGTTCDFASSLVLPKSNMLSAANRIMSPKKIFEFDVGVFNGRAFTYVAAFGAFTNVAYKTQQKFKNALGYFAYILEGVQQLPNLKPTRVRLVCEEGEFEDDYLLGMISNSASVAGFSFPGKRVVKMDDGYFELMLVRHPSNLAELGELSGALLRGNISSPLLTNLRVREATITAQEPLPWTLDGEFGGECQEAVIKVKQKALSICI